MNYYLHIYTMKKNIILILAAAAALAACTRPMPRGNWSKAPYDALCKLMKECKAEADAVGHNVNYAVFDYDNTTVMQDVELAVMSWQLSNLRVRFTPDEVPDIFAAHIPDLDLVLVEAGAEGVTARMLLADIENDYRTMMAAAGADCGDRLSADQLAALRQMPEYQDFKVKVWALYEGVCYTFDYREGFTIIAGLFHAFTYPELDALVKEGVAEQVGKKCIKDIIWESPDMGAAGKLTQVIPDGLALSDEMRNLYNALPANGIDVYIFSASMEAVVEAMACDPQYLGLDTSRVYALRMKRDGSGLVLQDYKSNYIRPYEDGKTKAIRAWVSPLYDGRDPVLIGGDSMGDYWMLTEFPEMRVGLIIDKGQTGPIGELREQALDAETGGAPSRYVLQRRGDPEPKFSRN